MAVPQSSSPGGSLYMQLIPETIEENYVETYSMRVPEKQPAPTPPSSAGDSFNPVPSPTGGANAPTHTSDQSYEVMKPLHPPPSSSSSPSETDQSYEIMSLQPPTSTSPGIDEAYEDVVVPRKAPATTSVAAPQMFYMQLDETTRSAPTEYNLAPVPKAATAASTLGRASRSKSPPVLPGLRKERPRSQEAPPPLPPGHPANKPRNKMEGRPLPALPMENAPRNAVATKQQSVPNLHGNTAAPTRPIGGDRRTSTPSTSNKPPPSVMQSLPAVAISPSPPAVRGTSPQPQHHPVAVRPAPSPPTPQLPHPSPTPVPSAPPQAIVLQQASLQQQPGPPPVQQVKPVRPPVQQVQPGPPPVQQVQPGPPPVQQVKPVRPPVQQVQPGPPPVQQVQPGPPPVQQIQPVRPPVQQVQPVRPPQQQVQPVRHPQQQVQPHPPPVQQIQPVRPPVQQVLQQRPPAPYPQHQYQPPPRQPYQAPPPQRVQLQQAPRPPPPQAAFQSFQPPPSYDQAMMQPARPPPHAVANVYHPPPVASYPPGQYRYPAVQHQQPPPRQMYPPSGYHPQRPPVMPVGPRPPQQPYMYPGHHMPVGYTILDSFAKDNVVLLIPLTDPELWPVRADGSKLKGGGSFTLQNDSHFSVVVPRQEQDHVFMLKSFSSKNYISINKKGRIVCNGSGDEFCEFHVRTVTANSPKVCIESVKFPGYFLAMNADGTPGDPKLVGASSKETHFIVRVQRFSPAHTMLSNPMACGRPSVAKQLRDRGVVQLQCASGTGFLTITKKGMVEESKPPKPNAPIDKNTQLTVYNRGMGVFSFRSAKHTDNWIRIKAFKVEGTGDPNLYADFFLKEAADGTVCFESLRCQGSHVTILSNQQAVTTFRIITAGQQT